MPEHKLGRFTFVAMTYNLWGEAHLAERTPALRAFFQDRQPDLLAVQELCGGLRDIIDAELNDHSRVEDDFAGWQRQSNLWWRRDMFTQIDYGTVDVGILAPDARLFWVRLQPADGGTPLIFSTAHLTWPGHADEQTDGRNRRTGQAERITEALAEIAEDGPCIFTVDINDIGAPLWTLGNAGLLDSFTALGRESPITHPVSPIPFSHRPGTRLSPIQSPAKAIDWIFSKGPLTCRSSEVVEYFHDASAPSDHKPVVSTFTTTT